MELTCPLKYFIRCIENHKNGLSRMAEATIEGLAFPSCPSREPGLAGRRGCLSEVSSAAAEKGSEGTALKT
jgi:hypothetical protein